MQNPDHRENFRQRQRPTCWCSQPRRGGGFPFTWNLQVCVEATGWGSGNYSNQDFGGENVGANSITNVAWGASVDASPANLPQILVNPCAAWHCIRNEFLCLSSQESLWRHYNRWNHLFNSRVHSQGNDRDVLVTRSFMFKIPVASVRNCLIPVTSVSNCLRIVWKITFCVTRSCCVWFIIFGIVDCQIVYFVYQIVRFI